MTDTVYDFIVPGKKKTEKNLADFKGKVLLIVNTASKCGFTPQYTELEEMYEKYHEQGLEILDFPCNQFFGQAPGTDEEIHSFCTLKYNVSFPQFHKIDVNGKNAHPLYVYLKSQKKGFIKWNFTKFLVSRNGEVVNRFGPADKPQTFEQEILAELDK